MSAKQDRQGVRTPSDIERKYDLSNKDYSDIKNMATSAQNAADRAASAAESAVQAVGEMDKRVTALEEGGGGGENGATFTPSVDADGNLSWTNDKGLDNPETVNIKGNKGDKGDTGEDGTTPVRGTDYWTEADKTEIVNEVLSELLSGDEVSY